MLQKSGKRALLFATSILLVLVAVPSSASAHDPDCTVATHVGPVKQHANCSGRDHEEICLLSLNVMFVHFDLFC